MRLVDGEPEAGPWRDVATAELAALLAPAYLPRGRPWVVAVDGRSGSGKTTLAEAVLPHLRTPALLHTDDLSWHEPMFGWRPLLSDALTQLRGTGRLHLVPPAWPAHRRAGSIDVDPGRATVVLEGVGASWCPDLVDAVVWVQSDGDEAERRGIARDLVLAQPGTAPEDTVAFWHEWVGHERRHVAAERPWRHADLVVCGSAATAPGRWRVADGPLA